jgi:hypothetical protein
MPTEPDSHMAYSIIFPFLDTFIFIVFETQFSLSVGVAFNYQKITLGKHILDATTYTKLTKDVILHLQVVVLLHACNITSIRLWTSTPKAIAFLYCCCQNVELRRPYTKVTIGNM